MRAVAKTGFPTPRLPSALTGRRLGHLLPASLSVQAAKIYRLSLTLTGFGLTVVSGAGTLAQLITRAVIQNMSAWDAVFNEYCITGLRVKLVAAAVANPSGYCAALLDEKSTATPVAGDLDKPHLCVQLDSSESPTEYVIEWKPADYLDLQWTATGTAYTPVTLKLFSSTTSTGTLSNTGGAIQCYGEAAVDFRGLK